MKSFLLILFTTLTLFTQAQSRKYYTYFNKQTDYNDSNAYYYIESTKLNSGLFEQKKYSVEDNKLIESRTCKSIDSLILHGFKYYYFNNGKVSGSIKYNNNLRTDTTYYYNEDGSLNSFTYFINDTPKIERGFYDSGELYYEEIYQNGLIKSTNYFYQSGEKKRICIYNDNEETIEKNCFTKEGLDTPYFKAYTNARLLSKEYASYADFLSANLKYPKFARNNSIEGKVVISFVVKEDNSLSSIKVIYATIPEFAEEALRIFKKSENYWIAASREGKPVTERYTLPIKFTLE